MYGSRESQQGDLCSAQVLVTGTCFCMVTEVGRRIMEGLGILKKKKKKKCVFPLFSVSYLNICPACLLLFVKQCQVYPLMDSSLCNLSNVLMTP